MRSVKWVFAYVSFHQVGSLVILRDIASLPPVIAMCSGLMTIYFVYYLMFSHSSASLMLEILLTWMAE